MEKKIIAIVGMPGAGKSLCVEFLTEHKIPSIYFGGITIDEIKSRGLDVTEANEKMIREEIRKKEGKAAYAKRMITKINALFEAGNDIVVADGLYSWTEYKLFKQHFDKNALIIAIIAFRKLRHERLSKRPFRPLTEEEVTSREYAEIENLEKGGPIANADYTILNNSTPKELLKQLKLILSEEHIDIT